MSPAAVWTAAELLLLFAAVAAHEHAHLVEARAAGLEVEEVNIGVGPKLAWYTLASGLRVTVHLLPFGGATILRGGNRHMELSPQEHIQIDGAGVWVNVATGLFALGLSAALHGSTWPWSFGLMEAGFLVATVRRHLARWTCALPVAAAALAAVCSLCPVSGLLLRFADTPSRMFYGVNLSSYIADRPADALTLGAMSSLVMALYNSLPLLPMDGGQIAHRWISGRASQRASHTFEQVSYSAYLLLWVAGVALDVLTVVLR